MKKAFYVPNFPIDRITQTGEDGWCHMPHHARMRYRYLDAVLEHIDNSSRIDPIQIVIHDEQQVHAGPSGVARLFALTHQRQYTHIPAVASSAVKYDWFGDGVVEITTAAELLSYFDPLYLPKSYSLDSSGAFWSNHSPYIEDIERSMRVSAETKNRLRSMIAEENQ